MSKAVSNQYDLMLFNCCWLYLDGMASLETFAEKMALLKTRKEIKGDAEKK